jgi:hypothetical protein
MTTKELQMTAHDELDDATEIAALGAVNAEARMRLALQTEIASKATERITGMAQELGVLGADLRVLKKMLREKIIKIEELEKSRDRKDKYFRSFQGELVTVSAALRQDPQLISSLNRSLVPFEIGLGLAAVGCSPKPWAIEGHSENATTGASDCPDGLVFASVASLFVVYIIFYSIQ